ncbi:YgaP family membrane protein [Thiohalophilus thiocyanatoxydans]|uniref:DUF2892 family protein n=1 Tax=Thiohalophilus thiocyanatoxydans TaxID=381308 RepID=A0A4R8ITS1_9GAMM|nr:DUF2892 domain-containing protein [Thiohalophilus thiocyanatoxydans]TDY03814.1 DUF2892 family protein [Thiohalophilus thiocyanatoxydans]
MTSERIIRSLAGLLLLLSLALGVEASPIYHSVHWLWLTLFVSLNLLQSGFTNFCPPEKLLKRFGIKSCSN